MNNHEMIRMARNVPEKAADLKRFKAHPRFFSRRGQDLIEALSAAEPIEKNRMPSPTAFEPGTEELFKTMKSWRSRVAEKRNLESGMILNNRVLKEIARQKPASLDQLKSLQLMTDWKTENYGPDLLKMIQSADGNGPEK